MIHLDRREPATLADELRKYGVPLNYPVHLEFGDLMFEGNGEAGPGSALIGLERKKLGDLINSMQDRRLSGHQLRGAWKTYDYLYLIAEGMWQPGSGGEIEEWGWTKERKQTKTGAWSWVSKQGWKPFFSKTDGYAVNYRHLSSYLHSLTLRSRHKDTGEPLRLMRTASVEETAAQVVALYKNFTEKRWDQHFAHDEVYAPGPLVAKKGHRGQWAHPHEHLEGYVPTLGNRASVAQSLGDPSTLWRMAAQLPGVDRKAALLAQYYESVQDMVLEGLEPKLRRQVELWFALHPVERVRAWMNALGIEKGEAKAQACVRAISVRGA